jgi:hypothetical protein
MARNGGSKVTPEQLYSAVTRVESTLGKKIDELARDTLAVQREHGEALVRLTERQAQNSALIDAHEKEIECIHDGQNTHSMQLVQLQDVPDILLGAERGKGQGLVDKFNGTERAVQAMLAFWRPIAIALVIAMLSGVGGFLWALLTGRIAIVEVAAKISGGG